MHPARPTRKPHLTESLPSIQAGFGYNLLYDADPRAHDRRFPTLRISSTSQSCAATCSCRTISFTPDCSFDEAQTCLRSPSACGRRFPDSSGLSMRGPRRARARFGAIDIVSFRVQDGADLSNPDTRLFVLEVVLHAAGAAP
eukprot:4915910-Pleurochrysis_carterae.AAC.5